MGSIPASGTSCDACGQMEPLLVFYSVQSRRHLLGGRVNTGSFLDRDGNFPLEVSFEVPNKKSQISIRPQEGSSEAWNIGDSPYSINTLVSAQQLDLLWPSRSWKAEESGLDQRTIQEAASLVVAARLAS